MAFVEFNTTAFITSDVTGPYGSNYDNIIMYPHTAEEHDLLNLVFGLVSSIIIMILQLVFIIYSIKIECAESPRKNKKPLRLAIGIFIGDFVICTISIIQVILFYNGSDAVIYTLTTIAVLNSFVISLLYLFMMLRLYQTFHESMYQISKCTLICHGIIIIYTAIGSLFFPYIVLSDVDDIEKILFSVILLVPFTLGLAHLIYLFNAKLFALVLLQRKTLTTRDHDDEQSLDERQLRLLRTVRKHTILGCFIVMAQVIVLFLGVFLYGLHDPYSDAGTVAYWIVTDICIVIESSCLFVGFTDNYNAYNCLCKHCDNRCTNICIKLVQNRMQNKGKHDPIDVAMTKNKDEMEDDDGHKQSIIQEEEE